MSAIEQRLKQLKDQENKLRQDQSKIDFLNHILQSAKEYDHKDYAEVKEDVVKMLAEMVRAGIVSIENGTTLTFNTSQNQEVPPPPADSQAATATQNNAAKPQLKENELGPNDKLSFALQHRELGGKQVQVLNKTGGDPYQGTVVGLDAPYVHVAIKDGPTIKALINEIERV